MKGFVLFITDDIINPDNINIREQISDIFDDPNNLGEINFLNEEEMMTCISKTLNHTKAMAVCNLWESRDILYTGYYIDAVDLMNINETDEKKIEAMRKKIKMNIFGSQLSNQNVASALVVIKNNLTYEIKDNNVKTISKPSSIESTNELIDVLTSVILKNGIVIKQDGSMQPYQYITNPLEHLILTVPNYENIYRYHEYEIYTHVLLIIVNTTIEPNKANLNKNATYLAGKPTYGDVFIGMYKKPDYNEALPYSSISIPILNKIINIRSKSTELTTNKTNAEHEYINFEKLLELEIDKHNNRPTINSDIIDGASLNIK
jgi:hypothetical protein